MKTFSRLIRRYILAAIGILLLFLFFAVGLIGGLAGGRGCGPPSGSLVPLPLRMPWFCRTRG